MKFFAVILAAGFSSRMQQFKPLLKLGDETVAGRVISLFRQNGVDVRLVTGWQRDKLLAGINTRDISIIDNPDYRQGMFSSVQAGLQSGGSGYDAFFIMPVDIPLVKPSTVKLLMDEYSRNPGKIIYPLFRKERGHPTLIPAGLVPVILAWKKEGNLKEILDSYPDLSLEVEVADINILCDIDTPEDYEKLLRNFPDKNGPCGLSDPDISPRPR
jgi:CTP:molybdopterin cytidylyltransferase MocA